MAQPNPEESAARLLSAEPIEPDPPSLEEYLHLIEDQPSLIGRDRELDAEAIRVLDLLTNAHALEILLEFTCVAGPRRFSELESALDISPKTLSSRLRELVEVGLLERRSYDEIPPRVEYEPTLKADHLWPMYQFLYVWVEHYDLDSTPSSEPAPE